MLVVVVIEDIINFLVSNGIDNFNPALYGACRGGHLNIAKTMISMGADAWNYGLYGACKGGYYDLIGLMMDNGATNCSYCQNQKHTYLKIK